MNKMVTKVVALTGAAMFAGALVAGVGAPAQVEARHIGGAAGIANLMNTFWDNGTNVQIFRTDYGYGAWATDSNGNIIGDEPIAKTPYYLASKELNSKKDSAYGDFVASYEVNINPAKAVTGIGSGNTLQVYYDEADFAQNVTDHFDHFANALPVWQNDFTAAAALDKNGNSTSKYVFGFEFGDYNPNYVEFGATTWNLDNYKNKDKAFVNNDEVGLWTNTKLPDFGAYGDVYIDQNKDGKTDWYLPEVYKNPVFEDANSFAVSEAFWRDWKGMNGNEILAATDANDVTWPGQIIPDTNGQFEKFDNLAVGYWGDFILNE